MPAACGLPAEEVVVHIGALGAVWLGPGGQTLEVVHGGQEPLVVVAGVVQDQIDDDVDVPGLTLGHQGFEIGHGAVLGIDVVVVPDVILVVALAGVQGHEPDAVDAQLLQIVQLGDDALQVADAVAVGVTEGVDKDFVEGAVIVIRRSAEKGDLGQCSFGLDSLSGFQSRPRLLGGGGFSIAARRGTSEQQHDRKQQAHDSYCSFHDLSP